MFQTADGRWAEKHGTKYDSAPLGAGMTPGDPFPWVYESERDKYVYDSGPIYYAIGK